MFEDDGLMMAYLQEDWAGPPKPWVDPRNQAQATHQALVDGLTDLRHEARLLSGGDWRDCIHQRGDEQRMIEREGVQVGWLHPENAAAGSAATATQSQTATHTPDTDGSDGTEDLNDFSEDA
jgi:capsid protein